MVFRFLLLGVFTIVFCGCEFAPTNSESTSRVVNQQILLREHITEGEAVSFRVHFVRNGRELSHDEWLEAMADHDGDFALKAMRGFAKTINQEKLHRAGFSLTADRNAVPFYWQISGKKDMASKANIAPGQTYTTNHTFNNILHGDEHRDDRADTTHAIAFNSSSMVADGPIRRLVIPRGAFVTLFDFAKTAKREEIADFFQLVKKEVEKNFLSTNKDFDYEVHSGSAYAQTVPHFHLRVYER